MSTKKNFLNIEPPESLTDYFYIVIEILANLIVVALSAALIGPKLIDSGVADNVAWVLAVSGGVVIDLAYLALFGRLPKTQTVAEYVIVLIGAFIFMAFSILTSMAAVQEIVASGQSVDSLASASAVAGVNWVSVIATIGGIASNVWNTIQRLAYLASPSSKDDFDRIKLEAELKAERRQFETALSQYNRLSDEYSQKHSEVPPEEKIKLAYKIDDKLYRQMFCTMVDVVLPTPGQNDKNDSGEDPKDFT